MLKGSWVNRLFRTSMYLISGFWSMTLLYISLRLASLKFNSSKQPTFPPVLVAISLFKGVKQLIFLFGESGLTSESSTTAVWLTDGLVRGLWVVCCLLRNTFFELRFSNVSFIMFSLKIEELSLSSHLLSTQEKNYES